MNETKILNGPCLSATWRCASVPVHCTYLSNIKWSICFTENPIKGCYTIHISLTYLWYGLVYLPYCDFRCDVLTACIRHGDWLPNIYTCDVDFDMVGSWVLVGTTQTDIEFFIPSLISLPGISNWTGHELESCTLTGQGSWEFDSGRCNWASFQHAFDQLKGEYIFSVQMRSLFWDFVQRMSLTWPVKSLMAMAC